ncbi:hypothetical protein HK405_005834, partial [Cladochytrium tenue]
MVHARLARGLSGDDQTVNTELAGTGFARFLPPDGSFSAWRIWVPTLKGDTVRSNALTHDARAAESTAEAVEWLDCRAGEEEPTVPAEDRDGALEAQVHEVLREHLVRLGPSEYGWAPREEALHQVCCLNAAAWRGLPWPGKRGAPGGAVRRGETLMWAVADAVALTPPNARVSLNGKVLHVGDGIWQALGMRRRAALDPEGAWRVLNAAMDDAHGAAAVAAIDARRRGNDGGEQAGNTEVVRKEAEAWRPPGVQLWNVVLDTLMRSGRFDAAWALLFERWLSLSRHGGDRAVHRPDAVTYMIAAAGCVRHDRLSSEFEHVLERAKDEAQAAAAERAEDSSQWRRPAQALLDLVREDGLHVTWDYLEARRAATGGDADGAEAVARTALQRLPKLVAAAAAASAAANPESRVLETAAAVRETVGVAIAAHVRCGAPGRALQLLADLEAASQAAAAAAAATASSDSRAAAWRSGLAPRMANVAGLVEAVCGDEVAGGTAAGAAVVLRVVRGGGCPDPRGADATAGLTALYRGCSGVAARRSRWDAVVRSDGLLGLPGGGDGVDGQVNWDDFVDGDRGDGVSGDSGGDSSGRGAGNDPGSEPALALFVDIVWERVASRLPPASSTGAPFPSWTPAAAMGAAFSAAVAHHLARGELPACERVLRAAVAWSRRDAGVGAAVAHVEVAAPLLARLARAFDARGHAAEAALLRRELLLRGEPAVGRGGGSSSGGGEDDAVVEDGDDDEMDDVEAALMG